MVGVTGSHDFIFSSECVEREREREREREKREVRSFWWFLTFWPHCFKKICAVRKSGWELCSVQIHYMCGR